ncbi:M14 family zinc carboxypeptidase [Desulfopila aestuarii]|uniref:carboxypeptidase T n=1 Tax=Desulfopila aestuarii DSM 18488 TaxID=1121416 RepID=A0A1M7Y8X4_9BACT|nr:M14 family zinc carboxypeptidase [Desulfopila aestuarii]SHO48978.1 Zinc carboxypeptidase [Desulfopila aestuarii DSM 18488]
MMKWTIVLAITFLFSTALNAAMESESEEIFLSPGETAIVRVYYPDQRTGNKTLISFEPQLLETNYAKGYHVMKVTQEDIDRLNAAGLRVKLDNTWTPSQPESQKGTDDEGIPGYPCYRTVEETYATAGQIAEKYPKLAQWKDIGDSYDKAAGLGGFDMRVLVLTNRKINGDKPDLFISAAMHAREYATAELVTRFAEYLVENYGTDADVTWILDHHEIHLMLHTNPDGRKIAEDHTFWRKNTNKDYCLMDYESRGADLNRNFTFGWNCCDGSSGDECNETFRGHFSASEPEIQAVESYMSTIFPVQRDDDWISEAPADATGIYIDVHAYGKLVLWPWGSTSDSAPNATQLQTLGRKFAYWNNYSPEQAIGLYPTDGTSDEHAYGHHGVASYCFEVGTSFFQSCKTFEASVLPDNLPALLYAAKVVRTPYITPSGPDATEVIVDQGLFAHGSQVIITATIDDTRYKKINGNEEGEASQEIAAAEYYVDIPPWDGGMPEALTPVDGLFDTTVEKVSGIIDTTVIQPGKHLIFVRGKDGLENWGAFTAVFLNIEK